MPIELQQEELAKVGWMWPAYMSRGVVDCLIRDLKALPEKDRRAALEAALPRLYDPHYLAAMVTERYAKVPVIKDFHHQIREAVESAMAGLYAPAVAALVPVVEGVLRGIGKLAGRDVGKSKTELSGEIDRLVEHETTHMFDARTTNERIDMLRGFQTFFNDHFFANTSEYKGRGELNRHGIQHALFRGFGERSNFYILISIIDHLTFIMTLRTSGISALAPDGTTESMALAQHYRRMFLVSQGRPALSGRPPATAAGVKAK